MKRTITESEFIDAFQGSYADSFSYEGKKALFEYFTELEEDTSFEMELDPIAIHCEYTEYKDFVYEHKIKGIEDIHEHTQVIEFTSSEVSRIKSFIIQQF